MTPFMALVIVTYLNCNPAADCEAKIMKEVFPDSQICEIAVAEKVAEAKEVYIGARVEGFCFPAKGESA